MNRRNFLFRSGMIAPAVLLLPDLVVADIQQDDADVLIIQGKGTRGAAMAEAFKKSGRKVKEVKVVNISGIRWNGQRFQVNEKNGAWYSVKKLVFNTTYMIDQTRGVVVMPVGATPVEVSYSGEERGRELPVFWYMKQGILSEQYARNFLNGKKGAFMCVQA